MRGKAYAIKNWEDTYAVSFSRLNAQEILMDIALEQAYYIFLLYLNYYGTSFEGAMTEARREADHFQIWEYDLV